MSASSTGRICALVAFALATLPGQEQESASPNLGGLNLESLLATKVTAVRRKEESLRRTAGAVYVITGDQIRRFGVSTIPEALRLVPGLDVARVGLTTWAISARGFNNVYSNKLLVMIDGRSVYNPVSGGVFWENQDTLIEDIDRIEVLRGPGAAMWGANAVNGVVNIITKSAQRTQGTVVTLGSGSEDQGMVRVRHGGASGKNGYYRVYGQQSFRAGSASKVDPSEDARWSMTQGGFRADWSLRETDTLTLQGDIYRSGAKIRDALALFNAPYRGEEVDHPAAVGGNFLMRWEHTHKNAATSVLQTYFDGSQRDTAEFKIGVQTADFEYQYQLPAINRQELAFSIGSKFISDSLGVARVVIATSPDRTYNIEHLTVQDDVSLAPDRLTLSLAARFEHNPFTGWNVQPTARLLWTPNRVHSLWTAISRSIRMPNRGELGFTALIRTMQGNPLPIGMTITGNPELSNEVGVSLEAGHRWQWSRLFSIDSAVFASQVNGILTFQPGTPVPQLENNPPYIQIPLMYRNGSTADSIGFESAVRAAVSRRLQLSGTVTLLQFPRITGAEKGGISPLSLIKDSPAQQYSLRSEWKPCKRCEADVAYFYYGGRMSALPSENTGRHRADIHLGWRATESMELSVGAQNMTPGNRTEFSAEPGPVSTAIRPAAYIRLTFRY